MLIIFILVSALCVPNVHMSKNVFLDCVKPYPDEYWVARHHGVPKRIDEKSGSLVDWIYVQVNGHEDKYTFTRDGRLRSQPRPKPSPQPSIRKLISPRA
ncbi:MAG: hypothetical protein JOZ91_03555 [Candidatus Eremiobacteraeota bacterium]|nr:hypothetical protein [Candidatus Eremiobacteraeota bacterium]MBV8263487.1 hypothetical protein [Candidatus Eremiobacteraeota bacterium]MBV8339725.1 hypothetical protein [Candidatus Eremiobacteraeota bacterium]MBV8460112.1 hypothetical protein [Candidatus Eremiobacteraeota bacterium]MBV8668423.1 hypothetical protein [Candidatus Eremiobacteraeota bacterium]